MPSEKSSSINFGPKPKPSGTRSGEGQQEEYSGSSEASRASTVSARSPARSSAKSPARLPARAPARAPASLPARLPAGPPAKSPAKSLIEYKYTKLQFKLNLHIYDHIYKNVNIISKFIKFNKEQIIETIDYLQKYGIYYIDIQRIKKEIKGGVATAGRDAVSKTIKNDSKELQCYSVFEQLTSASIRKIFNRLNSPRTAGGHVLLVRQEDLQGRTNDYSIKVVMNFNNESGLLMIGFMDMKPPEDVKQSFERKDKNDDIKDQNYDNLVLPMHYSFFTKQSTPVGTQSCPISSHFSIYSDSCILAPSANNKISEHSDPSMGTMRTNWRIRGIEDTASSGDRNTPSIKIYTPVVSFEELLEVLNSTDLIKKISFTEESDGDNFYVNNIDSMFDNNVQSYLENMCSRIIPAAMRQVLNYFLIPATTDNYLFRSELAEKDLKLETEKKYKPGEVSIRHCIVPIYDAEERRKQLALYKPSGSSNSYSTIKKTYNKLEPRDAAITVEPQDLMGPSLFNRVQFGSRALQYVVPDPIIEIISLEEKIIYSADSSRHFRYVVGELELTYQAEELKAIEEQLNQEWNAVFNKQKSDLQTQPDLLYGEQERIIYKQFTERYRLAVRQYIDYLMIRKLLYYKNDLEFFKNKREIFEFVLILQKFAFGHIKEIVRHHHDILTEFYNRRIAEDGLTHRTAFRGVKEYQKKQLKALTTVLDKQTEVDHMLVKNFDHTTPEKRKQMYDEQSASLKKLGQEWENTLKDDNIPYVFNSTPPNDQANGTQVHTGKPSRAGGNGRSSSSASKKSKKENVLTFVCSTVNDILQTSNYFKIIPVITELSNIKPFEFTDKDINNKTIFLEINTIIEDELDCNKFKKILTNFNVKKVALNATESSTEHSDNKYFIRDTIKSQVLKLTHKDLLENLTYSKTSSDGREIGKFISSYEYDNPESSLLKIISPKNTKFPYFQKEVIKPKKVQSAQNAKKGPKAQPAQPAPDAKKERRAQSAPDVGGNSRARSAPDARRGLKAQLAPAERGTHNKAKSAPAERGTHIKAQTAPSTIEKPELDEKFLLLSLIYTMTDSNQANTTKRTRSESSVQRNPTHLIERVIYIKQ